MLHPPQRSRAFFRGLLGGTAIAALLALLLIPLQAGIPEPCDKLFRMLDEALLHGEDDKANELLAESSRCVPMTASVHPEGNTHDTAWDLLDERTELIQRHQEFLRARGYRPHDLMIVLSRLKDRPDALHQICRTLTVERPSLALRCLHEIGAPTDDLLPAFAALRALTRADLEQIAALPATDATRSIQACLQPPFSALHKHADRSTLGPLAFKLSVALQGEDEPRQAACLRRLSLESCRDALEEAPDATCSEPRSVVAAILGAADRSPDELRALHQRGDQLAPLIDTGTLAVCETPDLVPAPTRAILRSMHITLAQVLRRPAMHPLVATDLPLFDPAGHARCANRLWCHDFTDLQPLTSQLPDEELTPCTR